jgi:uncharacterized protein (TIGR03083 family)
VTTVDAMGLARDERADLAELLAALTPAQWEAPTLCSRWSVREVVAHVFSYEELSTTGLIGRFLRGGVVTARVNQIGVDALADRGPDELLLMALAGRRGIVGELSGPGLPTLTGRIGG